MTHTIYTYKEIDGYFTGNKYRKYLDFVRLFCHFNFFTGIKLFFFYFVVVVVVSLDRFSLKKNVYNNIHCALPSLCVSCFFLVNKTRKAIERYLQYVFGFINLCLSAVKVLNLATS